LRLGPIKRNNKANVSVVTQMHLQERTSFYRTLIKGTSDIIYIAAAALLTEIFFAFYIKERINKVLMSFLFTKYLKN